MTFKSFWFVSAVLLNLLASRTAVAAYPGETGKYCTKTFGVCSIDFGTKGFKGLLVSGKQGPIGLKGDQGPRGIPGTPGTHPCIVSDPEEDLLDAKTWGTETSPASQTCKNGPSGINGKRTLNPSAQIEVNCIPDTGETCPIIKTKGKETVYKEKKPFWLSEKSVTVKDTYGLSSLQLKWLQRQSNMVNLTIIYHCKNSVPVGVNSLSLLTWNDIVIGPAPTESTPFYYSIKNDGCSSAKKDTWSSTDIILASPFVGRLPIVDFLIKDVRNGNQAVRIEIKELCFT